MIRQKVYQLEQAQIKMKQEYAFNAHLYILFHGEINRLFIAPSFAYLLRSRYEAEIRTLRRELESRGVHLPQSHIGGLPTHAGPSQAPPPALGHGPANLFGGIMANPGGGAPALAPPPPPDQQPPQHALQQPGSGAQVAPQPQQGAFGGYQPTSAVNGMLQSQSPPLNHKKTIIAAEKAFLMNYSQQDMVLHLPRLLQALEKAEPIAHPAPQPLSRITRLLTLIHAHHLRSTVPHPLASN